MKLVFFLFSLLLIPENRNCLMIDIILVGDLSGSIDDNEYFVANAFEAFVDRFELGESAIKIGAIVFGSDTYILSHLTSSKTELYSAIDFIRNNDMSSGTKMSKALITSLNEFKEYGRRGVRQIIVVISDGAVDSYDASMEMRMAIKKDGINLCGIYVDTISGQEDFMVLISDPACYVSTSYQALVEDLKRLDVCF